MPLNCNTDLSIHNDCSSPIEPPLITPKMSVSNPETTSEICTSVPAETIQHAFLDTNFPPLSATYQQKPSATAPLSFKKAPTSFAEAVISPSEGSPPLSPRTLRKSFDKMFESPAAIPVRGLTLLEGKPSVVFTPEEVSILAKPFKFALVGKFSVKRPVFSLVVDSFKKWGFKGEIQIRALKPGFILIIPALEEDFNHIWMKTEWFIAGAYMRVFKWSPEFSYSHESSIAPVWVAFPDLPIHFYEKTALYSLASVVGKPLRIDGPTANKSRPTVARVYVEVDLCQDRLHEFWVTTGQNGSGFLQRIIFENLPSYCELCKHRGHSSENCRRDEFIFKRQNNREKKNKEVRNDTLLKSETPSENQLKQIENQPLASKNQPGFSLKGYEKESASNFAKKGAVSGTKEIESMRIETTVDRNFQNQPLHTCVSTNLEKNSENNSIQAASSSHVISQSNISANVSSDTCQKPSTNPFTDTPTLETSKNVSPNLSNIATLNLKFKKGAVHSSGPIANVDGQNCSTHLKSNNVLATDLDFCDTQMKRQTQKKLFLLG